MASKSSGESHQMCGKCGKDKFKRRKDYRYHVKNCGGIEKPTVLCEECHK